MKNLIKLVKKFQLYIVIFLSLIFLYIFLKYAAIYLVTSSIKSLVDESSRDKVKLENISFEPLSLTLKMENLDLDDSVSLGFLYVDFSFPNIIQKKINISKIKIENLKGNIVTKGDGFLANLINKNKSRNYWNVAIDKAEISNSIITLNKKDKIEFKKVEVHNFDMIKNDKLMEIEVLASINGSNILLEGNISDNKSFVEFDLNDFDLNILNVLIGKEDLGFGKINGNISSKGFFEIKNGVTKLSLNLRLRDLFLYSKDLKLITYFAKELNTEKLTLENNASSLNIKSTSLEISNLLFSISSNKFRQDKLSKFSKIKINDIDVSDDKKTLLMKGLVNFSDGGFVAFNRYEANNKMMLDVKANGIDLTKFSRSFEPLLNYQIESGKMWLDAKTSFGNDKIKGSVKINFSQLKLDNKNEFGEKLENQSLIPLKTAISMIKDDNGNIELDFNLYGNKDDPNFDILGMLGKGIGSVAISKVSSIIATKMAVKFTPMLLSSIPMSPGNIFMFTNGAYKMIVKPRFKDIDFSPLKSDFEKYSEANLVDLTQFLRENKEAKLHICPVASTLEFKKSKVNDIKVLTLANNRVESLKKYFKNRGESGILNQVIFCRPKISDDSDVGKAVISL